MIKRFFHFFSPQQFPSRQALAERRRRGFGGKFLSKEESQVIFSFTSHHLSKFDALLSVVQDSSIIHYMYTKWTDFWLNLILYVLSVTCMFRSFMPAYSKV